MPTTQTNQPRRILLLTGASRGIGHATVKRFSAAGWRVITCSRHPFPENCPWEAGPEDHVQVNLADEANTLSAIEEIRRRIEGHELHALVNNAAISPKGAGGKRLGPPHPGGGRGPRPGGGGGATSAASAFASTPLRRARSTPQSCRPAPRRSSSKFRCSAWARPTRWPRSFTCCARRRALT